MWLQAEERDGRSNGVSVAGEPRSPYDRLPPSFSGEAAAEGSIVRPLLPQFQMLVGLTHSYPNVKKIPHVLLGHGVQGFVLAKVFYDECRPRTIVRGYPPIDDQPNYVREKLDADMMQLGVHYQVLGQGLLRHAALDKRVTLYGGNPLYSGLSWAKSLIRAHYPSDYQVEICRGYPTLPLDGYLGSAFRDDCSNLMDRVFRPLQLDTEESSPSPPPLTDESSLSSPSLSPVPTDLSSLPMLMEASTSEDSSDY